MDERERERVEDRDAERERVELRDTEGEREGEREQLAALDVAPAAHALAQPQGVHALLAPFEENFPAGQSVQSPPSVLYSPGKQASQKELPKR